MRAVVLAILAAWTVLAPVHTRAQLSSLEVDSDQEIEIDAQSLTYDREAEQVFAEGDVVIRRGETVLRADTVRVDRRTTEAEAFGNVSLTDVDAVIFADHMQINLKEETGALLGADIHSERFGYSLQGTRMEKRAGQSYHIENGRFTTCRCDEGPPSWSIAGKSLDVTLDGYGLLEAGTFNILDVPVLYVPRLPFPVQRERQSGLLVPRVGISNRRGFQLLQPIYWAIDKSQDATFGIDVETQARVGVLGEYRYALSRDFHGTLGASYFNEAIRGAATEVSTGRRPDPNVPENRWSALGEHTQHLGGFDAYADVLVVSDDLFLREINTFTIDRDRDVALRTLPFTTSRVGALKSWSRVALQGEFLGYQDLIGRDALVLQRLPEVRASAQKLLGAGIQGQLISSAVDFQRTRGVAGLRLDLQPGIQIPLPLGRSFSGALAASFHETAYQLTADTVVLGCLEDADCPSKVCVDGICQEPPEHLPDSQTRETVELRADIRTGVSRIFEFHHFGVDKLKHTIEPQLEYRFIPDIDQDELPLFDGLDRVNQRSLVTYGVASRLLARTAATPPAGKEPALRAPVYEVARLSIAQSYDFERIIDSVGGLGDADHFSDIDVALRVNPSRSTVVRVRSSYDTSTADISTATVGIRLQEPQWGTETDERRQRLTTRNSFTVAYRFITNNLLQQLESSTTVRLTDRIGALYATRYDITENRFLENHFGFRYISACDCWSIDIGVTDKSNPNETEVRAQVTLVGLGSSGGFGLGN